MMNFDDLNKVTNVICKPTPHLTVKHVIYLRRNPFQESKPYGKDPRKDRKINYAFPYESKDKFGNATNDNNGLYFQNGDVYLELEARRQVLMKDAKDNKTQAQTVKYSCTFRDIPILIGIIDRAYSWLTNNDNDIFVRDCDGRPLKVVDPLLQLVCPIRSGSLMFKPCIIRDTQDIRYEGISLMSQKDGELTNFTAPEFAMFRMAIVGFGNNYYLANQMLILQSMSYCTNSNLTEVLSKNAKSTNKPQ